MAGGDERVGVEEAADGGVVIAALQIIEPGILGGRLAILSFLPCLWFLLKPETLGSWKYALLSVPLMDPLFMGDKLAVRGFASLLC